jgi:3-phosphoshikimate 1-carboxyvinyltransferase
MRKIKPLKSCHADVTVPGSKSYTHRMLIAAALSNGNCSLNNLLLSEDTHCTMNALKQLGVRIELQTGRCTISGKSGALGATQKPIELGNSGTSMRLLTAVAALGKGTHILTGTERMQQRPIADLLAGLKQIGVKARSLHRSGCPPVEVSGKDVVGGKTRLNCATSSQFLSAFLLIGPCTNNGVEITVTAGPVSRPYVDITLGVMQAFGINVERNGYEWFNVPGMQAYQAGSYTVEPDCSQAGYFWAAAAVTGGTIKVKSVSANSLQGDIRFLELLNAMGCKIITESDGIGVCGGPLTAIEADMGDMPDLVPTLAAIAAFARGTTIITNIAHLKDKESNRLAAVVNELTKMGIEAGYDDRALRITGGQPHGAEIETYNDHRIAMSFAVAGLKTDNVFIKNEMCVEKSFPDFWRVFDGLYAGR